MTLDFSEGLISLAQAATMIPGRPNISTLWRWWRIGIRGHRLQTCVIGARRFTSRSWIEDFIAATTAAADGDAPPARTPRQRERAIETADRELRDAGL